MEKDFDSFVRVLLDARLEKSGQAASFMWWAEQHDGKPSASLNDICSYFERARLHQPNRTRLERDLRREKYVTRDKAGRYRLTQGWIEEGRNLFAEFRKRQNIGDLVSEIDIGRFPYIGASDIVDARKMADLYVSLYCLENSIRRHIQKVLSENLGDSWWEVAASEPMKRKEQDRLNNETRNKWIPSRANSGPLYSLDWADLVTLMRKHQELFKDSISDINFLHRFSDLGNLRNVVAHNGVIAEQMQFRRVELALHDWARQIGA